MREAPVEKALERFAHGRIVGIEAAGAAEELGGFGHGGRRPVMDDAELRCQLR
jgi:hypothetical protein